MKKSLFLIIFFISIKISAQNESAHWYFGTLAGLDFSSGSPIADTQGALATSEGCATISDANGNLLFYTDGFRGVWNRNHQFMPSVPFATLLGNPSSSQSAIIVPKPNDTNIYYIFTVDATGGTNGLNYYTVDMRLDNGLGDVIGINNTPTVTNLLIEPTSEKITAVKVKNEDAFWVIAFRLSQFFAFKVDANGVNPFPIGSGSGFSGSEDTRGYLKVSPDGTMLVSANINVGTYFYDFDSTTGIVSNERQLNVDEGYGVEFSPLSKKLYISTGNLGDGPETETLLQFTVDIPLPTADNLNATRVLLHSYVNQRAALQVGLDGKIYRAINRANFLGVITNPEGDGIAANYIHNAVSLGDKVSIQGLPPFIQSFFIATIGTENICLGDTTNFTIFSNEPVLSIVWDFGDGSPTSTTLNPSHIYALPGDYTIVAEVTTANGTQTFTQSITIYDLPNITTPVILQQCDDDTDGISNFNLREAESILSNDDLLIFTYHLSQADAEANTGLINNISTFSNATSSQVFARVENQIGCFRIAEINLQVSTTAIPTDFMLTFNECDTDLVDEDFTNGITIFDFSSATQDILALFPSNQNLLVTYYENIEDALAEQNVIDATNYRNENSPFTEQIVVRVDSKTNNACLGLGFHITLNVDTLPEFDVISPQFLCLNLLPKPLSLMVENPQDNYTYEWRDQNGILLNPSSTTSLLEVINPGDYFVTATATNKCERTKKVTVQNSNIATFENIEVFDVSSNNTISVIVSGEGDYEYALNNINGPYQESNFFENVPPGLHTVFVRDRKNCGIVNEIVSVIGFPKFFTPNGDGFHDTWQVYGVNVASQFESIIYIFDRYGKLLKQLSPQSLGWDGTFNGEDLPSNDYWFHIKLQDGRVFKSHFTLKR